MLLPRSPHRLRPAHPGTRGCTRTPCFFLDIVPQKVPVSSLLQQQKQQQR
jgi:hypothetical protein